MTTHHETRESDYPWALRWARAYRRRAFQGDPPTEVWLSTSMGTIHVPLHARRSTRALADYLERERKRLRNQKTRATR